MKIKEPIIDVLPELTKYTNILGVTYDSSSYTYDSLLVTYDDQTVSEITLQGGQAPKIMGA